MRGRWSFGCESERRLPRATSAESACCHGSAPRTPRLPPQVVAEAPLERDETIELEGPYARPDAGVDGDVLPTVAMRFNGPGWSASPDGEVGFRSGWLQPWFDDCSLSRDPGFASETHDFQVNLPSRRAPTPSPAPTEPPGPPQSKDEVTSSPHPQPRPHKWGQGAEVPTAEAFCRSELPAPTRGGGAGGGGST